MFHQILFFSIKYSEKKKKTWEIAETVYSEAPGNYRWPTDIKEQLWERYSFILQTFIVKCVPDTGSGVRL